MCFGFHLVLLPFIQLYLLDLMPLVTARLANGSRPNRAGNLQHEMQYTHLRGVYYVRLIVLCTKGGNKREVQGCEKLKNMMSLLKLVESWMMGRS